MILHGYWRSTASYRVRIALNLKGLSYAQVTHDLRTGAQASEEYRALQPQGLVPALEADEAVLVQSPAILEWLEERYPEPALLPASLTDRATVRAMAAVIGCDIHPLNNLRVLNALSGAFAASPDQVNAWIARWIGDGFAALEGMIARHGGGFAFGDRVSLADCYLVPQLYSAERFGVDLAAFPALVAAAERARALPEVAAAHPDRQPDADR
ncbi:maleylacetoacetate isomerase [Sphingomonas aracearum]|uniref:Maleylacetoacetate isomerase n=1 Tax=Sphingomonas aracearum TaxID=2283317 RepID=A0A369VSL3_9SPHN|nr:maleylacetoacetate isomerase [Sphingomonas aracearum]RDE05013.1 maleylacetoacetate isomerase [Sphingomonas aracearum]